MSVLLAIALVVPQTAPASAQPGDTVAPAKLAREGYALSKSDAENLEALLRNSPNDLAARTRLLGFYFRGAIRVYGREATIEARRRHILWLIEHHPESHVTVLSETTIDPAGHALADRDGYEQASTLWMAQAQRHAKNAAVLGHAARFYLLSNKERAVSLLTQAQRAEPANREWSAQLGYAYALAILGVDLINQNGLPTSHNPAEAKGDFALRAADELRKSTDAITVGVAGRILAQYGLILNVTYRGPDRFAVDFATLAETFLAKAQELDPVNPQWSSDLEQFRKLRTTATQPK